MSEWGTSYGDGGMVCVGYGLCQRWWRDRLWCVDSGNDIAITSGGGVCILVYVSIGFMLRSVRS